MLVKVYYSFIAYFNNCIVKVNKSKDRNNLMKFKNLMKMLLYFSAGIFVKGIFYSEKIIILGMSDGWHFTCSVLAIWESGVVLLVTVYKPVKNNTISVVYISHVTAWCAYMYCV